ncbi:hypothetical protein Tco_0053405 [Tanacetum coccineum]
MPWYSQCSWCGGLFNGGNYRRCTNMSYGEEFVRNPDPISNDETPEFSYPPSQPQTSSLDQRSCFHCGGPLVGDVRCQRCTCKTCGCYLSEGFCRFCKTENSSINPPNDFTHPPQPQYESNSCDKCGNDSHTCANYVGTILTLVMIVHLGSRFYSGFDQPPQYSINHQEDLNQQRISDVHNGWDKIDELQNELFLMIQSFCEKFLQQKQAASIDQSPLQEMSLQEMEDLKDIISKLPPSIAITPVLPTLEPEDSLIMGNEELSTIPKKDSDKVIKSSVEDRVPIPCESEDTSKSDSDCDLPSCDNLSPINILYDDPNDDLIFDPGGDVDELDVFLDIDIPTNIKDGFYDSEGDVLYLESLVSDDTTPSLPPELFLDRDPRSLRDINDLKIMVKDCPDYEDSRACGFVHRSLDLQSFACLYMRILKE